MSENFNAKGEIELELKGLIGDIDALTDKIGELNETFGHSTDVFDKLERQVNAAGSAARKAAGDTDSLGGSMRRGKSDVEVLADGFDVLIDRLAEYESAAKAAAQAAAVGGTSPLAGAMGTMNLEEAEEVLRILEAQGMTAGRAARQVVDAEEQKKRAAQDYESSMRAGAARLEKIQRNRVEAEAREENRIHDLRIKLRQQEEDATRKAVANVERMRLEEASRVAGLGSDAQSQGAAWRNQNSWDNAEAAQASELRNLREAILGRAAAEDEATRASEAAARATDTHTASLPRLRYALYDVATTAGVVSAAVTAASVAAVAAASSYESSFTDVERTTLATAETTERLRADLMQLTREIPESWGSITEIASVGAQLDIAEDSLESFTETTTKFSTVTGISAETSAMAFGSLGQLLSVTAGEYENMGSAIAYVGVTSVATDEEIVKMSQRLAASAANAGMTAQEVIALSGALASLRVAPERAQGVMEVYFRNLNNALAEGGERLEAFAHYARMSTADVEEMVATDPARFFRELSAGLGTLDPVSATQALDQLGLSGIRAGEVFTRVSNNLEVFDQAMANSNQAWAEGSHLAHAYGLVVDDLASKWQIFLNGVMELTAAIGGPFMVAAKPALDIATAIVNALADFANTPVGATISAIVGLVGLLVGALAAVMATVALATASMAAMSTALKEVGAEAILTKIKTQGLGAGMVSLAGQIGIGTAAINTFKWALASTGIGLAVIAIGTLVTAALQLGNTAQASFDKFVGSTGGLSDALRADATAYQEALNSGNDEAAKSFTELSGAASAASESLDEGANAARNVSATLYGATDAAYSAASGVQELTRVIGDNTVAWLKNQLMQSEAFSKLAGDGEFRRYLDTIGADFDELITIAADKGSAAAQEWLIGLEDGFRLAEGGLDSDSVLADFWTNTGLVRDSGELYNALQTAGEEMRVMQEKAALLGMELDVAGDSAIEMAGSASALNSELLAMVDSAYATVNAEMALNNALSQVGEELYKNGAAAAFTGSSFQTAIRSIVEQSAGSAPVAAANLQVLFDYIVKGGYASAAQLVQLQGVIAQFRAAAGGKTAAPTMAMPDFNAIGAGYSAAASSMGRAGSAAGAAAEKVRTLKDYASDLAKVWERAFDIRFSGEQTLDNITSAWSKIRKEISDAADAIAKYQAEMQELAADKSTMEYWLMVAENYGDVLRAEELRAKLAAQDVKLAEASKKLAAEQDKTNKTLEGNSDAAIKNRAEILSLVSGYQDHIGALAASGMSSEELAVKTAQLKQQFIDQAVQLGYSRAEVNKYAVAFDDVRIAINKIDRNITVNANVNPALQALNEYNAQLDRTRANVSRGGFSPSINPSVGNGYTPGANYGAQFTNGFMDVFQRRIRSIVIRSDRLDWKDGISIMGGYRKGGRTSTGPDDGISGVVHNNEFVFSAPAARNIGYDTLAFLHNAAKGGTANASRAQAGGTMVVELSPYDRQLLVNVERAAGVNISADALSRAAIAGAVNSGRTGRG